MSITDPVGTIRTVLTEKEYAWGNFRLWVYPSDLLLSIPGREHTYTIRLDSRDDQALARGHRSRIELYARRDFNVVIPDEDLAPFPDRPWDGHGPRGPEGLDLHEVATELRFKLADQIDALAAAQAELVKVNAQLKDKTARLDYLKDQALAAKRYYTPGGQKVSCNPDLTPTAARVILEVVEAETFGV